MPLAHPPRRSLARPAPSLLTLSLAAGLLSTAACAHHTASMAGAGGSAPAPMAAMGMNNMSSDEPNPDPRIGLKAGLYDAGTAAWNMRLTSTTRPSEKFVGSTMSDLAFLGQYAIQGSYNGYQVWDVSDAAHPALATAYYCPASQSDVSVYRNLLFVSGEGLSGRLDCGAQGVQDTVSHDRLRGLRIFDISDIRAPKYIGNVQTCRGSHTHTLLVDPKDPANVYVYISGSAPVRSPNELPGCSGGTVEQNPNSAQFRIEVIRIPLAHPEQAAIVTSPRIFAGLTAPPTHGATEVDRQNSARLAAQARQHGGFTVMVQGEERVLPNGMAHAMLDSIARQHGAAAPTAADSATLRSGLQAYVDKMMGGNLRGPRTGPNQCHDITVYPAIGLAGGACEGYGLLLDISDPANPQRIGAVSDSNFSYWHSATFNNDGTKVLFTDEWGGGGQPKCRSTDPRQWGADAIFTLQNRQMQFQSYYKLPAPQTAEENCVAHNGNIVPVPGRDIMVQSWYQGGVSVFDFTDPKNIHEIAFFDRGPVDSTHMAMGGTWSAYWYNGKIVSSEIARGLDVLELQPSTWLSQNELDAAKSVHLDYLNAQDQPHISWTASFAVARAYVDQLERGRGIGADRITAIRQALAGAEGAQGGARASALNQLASQLDADAGSAADGTKVRTLAGAVRDLANASR